MLFAYWDQLRAGRHAPRRDEVDPTCIAAILPNVLMLDCQQPGNYRFRIAGTRLCEYFDKELRGYNFFNMWHPFERKSLGDRLAQLRKSGDPATFDVASRTSRGDIVYSEVVMLPLSKPDGTIYRLLGAWSLLDSVSLRNAACLTEHALLEPGRLKADRAMRSPTLFGTMFQTHELSQSCKDRPGNEGQLASKRHRFRVYQGGRL